MSPDQRIRDCKIGEEVKIYGSVNLYECEIGDLTKVGSFVEIQKNSKVGRACKISSHSFICEGVEIEDEVFIGHGVMFTNDKFPRATNPDGTMQTAEDWAVVPTKVCRRASIGSGSVILPGLTIGAGAMIGAGSVVTRSVPENAIVAGNPAKVIGEVSQ